MKTIKNSIALAGKIDDFIALAGKIDDFVEQYDPFGSVDVNADKNERIAGIALDIFTGATVPYKECLADIVENCDDEDDAEYRECAENLLNEINGK